MWNVRTQATFFDTFQRLQIELFENRCSMKYSEEYKLLYCFHREASVTRILANQQAVTNYFRHEKRPTTNEKKKKKHPLY